MTNSIVISFDWSESPGEVIDGLATSLDKFESPQIRQIEDTGGDNYVAVIGERPVTEDDASRAFMEWLRGS